MKTTRQRGNPTQLLDENRFPILTPERQVEVDTLNGPFSIGTRVFAFYDPCYYPAIVIRHKPDYSQYQLKCTEDKIEHWMKYVVGKIGVPSFFPLSCLQVGDVIGIQNKGTDGNKEFISITLTNIPSKNNANKWAAGMFGGRQETKNVEELFDWRKFYMTEADGVEIYRQRFTCKSRYPPNRVSVISPPTALIRPNVIVTTPIQQTLSARNSRASNRRSKNDTAKSNSTTSANKTPAKRPRKRTTATVKQSPSRSTIFLHDSNEDSLANHSELLMENQIPQSNYALPSFLPEELVPTTSSAVPVNRRGRKRHTTNTSSNISMNELQPTSSSTSSSVSAGRSRQSTNIIIDDIGEQYLKIKEAVDLTRCELDFGGKKVEVPKGFLVARSGVFARLLSSSHENIIKIGRCKPDVINVFAEYFHRGKKTKELNKYAFDLLPLAEKYEMNELKTQCLENLDTLITDASLFAWIKSIPEHIERKELVLNFIKNKASETLLSSIFRKLEWIVFGREHFELAQEILNEANDKIEPTNQ